MGLRLLLIQYRRLKDYILSAPSTGDRRTRMIYLNEDSLHFYFQRDGDIRAQSFTHMLCIRNNNSYHLYVHTYVLYVR